MSHWFFIINPTAGRRNGLRVWKSIQKELIKRKVEHRSFLTEHPGHAEVLARQISTIQEYKLKRLIVIGGDGTMHEVVNGLKDVDDIELSFVPAGAYNDFSRGFSIKKVDLMHEIRKQKRPLTRSFHLGSVNFFQDKSQVLYFMNHIGIGFDAYVNKKALEFPLRRVFLFLRLRFLVYPLSHLRASATFKPFSLACTVEGETQEFHDVWFAVVSNHPFYRGGMKAAPLANPREKAFDIVIVENQPFLKKYWLLCLMAFGKHIKMDGVTMFKAKDITFYTKDKIPFHADGEIMGTTPFRLASSPSPLRIKT
ncbi:YegS/Rv2252/BmrU family lipid kinase [Bacillus sp. RHFS10]|uniref:YegS/Rv2252/BmrU family lipid kinase n=1 Tax=Bacillus sp. RHFS10 TaxID=2804501 RepID=UPI0019295013|nr:MULTISPECIES: YegS/Rv2252/BmrU family lipid kinase [Bacillus]MBL3646098.1 YegS/Rv2252/BmrU family lipid kinase [Bacillus sp. RHFS10]MDM5302898.1 YegS/Rv2252/BmrU family lipid kinase [Bacillus subtilis]MDM5324951.1 YegS/Rv2252/BmrU family lipid kinase [Bacillus subtilis]